MNTKNILLCCLLCAASIPTFGHVRDYAYILEEPKWVEERAQAKADLLTTWTYIKDLHCRYLFPDSVISDSIVQDSRIVNGGELHRVEYFDGRKQTCEYYYKDSKHNIVRVMDGVSANNGQPYSFDEYYYIDRNGMVTFNTRKYIEMILWCCNVYLSPLLWLALMIYLIYKGMMCFIRSRLKES